MAVPKTNIFVSPQIACQAPTCQMENVLTVQLDITRQQQAQPVVMNAFQEPIRVLWVQPVAQLVMKATMHRELLQPFVLDVAQAPTRVPLVQPVAQLVMKATMHQERLQPFVLNVIQVPTRVPLVQQVA